MRPKTWILVSDATKAKLFEAEGPHMEEVADYVHLEGNLPGRELVSSPPGRRGQGIHPPLGPSTPPKEVEAAKFARRLAGELKHGLDAHRYGSLVLVAPPHFLGLLRKSLDPEVEKRTSESQGRNYLGLDPAELKKRLQALVRLSFA